MTKGERIKAARERRGLTQSALAEKMGIPYQSISQWERNVRNPKYETVKKIAAALDCDPEWLQTGVTDKEFRASLEELSGAVKKALHPAPLNEIIQAATNGTFLEELKRLSPDDIDTLLNYLILLKLQENIFKQREDGQSAVDPQENDKDGA